MRQLNKALEDNRLTIVCGAGVSVGAGIPNWNDLLLKAFKMCIDPKLAEKIRE